MTAMASSASSVLCGQGLLPSEAGPIRAVHEDVQQHIATTQLSTSRGSWRIMDNLKPLVFMGISNYDHLKKYMIMTMMMII